MLDHLSDGRFEFGTGRGSSTTEQGGFGIDDPDLTKEMFDEVIGEFVKMWSAPSPTRTRAGSSRCPRRPVLPKPWVPPHPPMWVAAGNPGTFEKAGRMGLGVLCFTAGNPTQMAPLIEVYKNAVADADPVGDFVNDNVAIVSQFLCLRRRRRGPRLGDPGRHRLPQQPAVPVPRHLPAAQGHPAVARDPARAHPGRDRQAHRGQRERGRQPRRVHRGPAEVRDGGLRPDPDGAELDHVAPRAHGRRRSSCSAPRSSPSSTTTPSTRTSRYRREAAEALGLG